MDRNHYLEVNFQKSLLALMSHLLPDVNVDSIQDLFNPSLFHQLLSIIFPQQLRINCQLLRQINQQTYLQSQIQIFIKVRQLLEQGYEKMGLNTKQWPSNKQITKMLKESDLDILQEFLEGVFMMITFNKKVLMTITTLDQCHQKQIQQFILLTRDTSELPDSRSRKLQKEYKDPDQDNQKWIQQLQYFQNLIETKDLQLSSLKNELKINLQEKQELNAIIQDKISQIQTLRKKLLAFQQIDTLLVEKDTEISHIQSKLNDIELKSRIRNSQLSKNYTDLQQKYNNLQSQHNEIQSKFNKMVKQLEQTKQRQESKDLANKTVIKNLKEKVKQLQDKSQDQQKQLLQIIQEKDKRQKQFQQILYKYEGPANGGLDQRFDETRSPYLKNPVDYKMKSTLGDQLKELSNQDTPNQQQSTCEKQQCNQIKKSYLDLIEQIVSALNLPSTAACKTLTEKAHFIHKYACKLSEIMNQNQKLKERIVSGSQSSNCDTQEIIKLKKKIQVMKNRLKQEERRRKQQSEILSGAMQQLIKNMMPQLS